MLIVVVVWLVEIIDDGFLDFRGGMVYVKKMQIYCHETFDFRPFIVFLLNQMQPTVITHKLLQLVLINKWHPIHSISGEDPVEIIP